MTKQKSYRSLNVRLDTDVDTLKASDLAKRLKFNTGSTMGVTKYMKESRTKLELKGRGGKAPGGCNKMKIKAKSMRQKRLTNLWVLSAINQVPKKWKMAKF